MSKVSIVGVPLDLGAEELGVDKGPQMIRERDIVKKLQDVGLDVSDEGDIASQKASQSGHWTS